MVHPEKECFAIFYALSKLEHLLLDREFIIHTDHVNLTFLKESKNARVNRWKLALQEYKYTIEFIKGSDNVIADSLSRLCVLQETTPPLTEEQVLHAFDEEDIDQATECVNITIYILPSRVQRNYVTLSQLSGWTPWSRKDNKPVVTKWSQVAIYVKTCEGFH
jgi:hypothetical protein